jgi:hypothetical protein
VPESISIGQAANTMALVEIEAGPFLVSAAVTRDAVEELGWHPGSGLRRSEGHGRDDRARRSERAARTRRTRVQTRALTVN